MNDLRVKNNGELVAALCSEKPDSKKLQVIFVTQLP